MTVKVGINGFGRIGRLVFRQALNSREVEVVAVNDLTDARMLAHLLKYDSVHGKIEADISVTDRTIVVNGTEMTVTSERDPEYIRWKDAGVDIVIEATGRFVDRESSQKHLDAGAKKVIISAPGKNEDVTVVMGVNEQEYHPEEHHIVSNASCTTNGLAPVAKVLHDAFTIKRGLMTTIHSYTNDQQILDLPHKDYRRARAAAENVIPTTTGAAKAVGKVLPDLNGKLNGMAVRVPTPDVSLIDLVVEVDKRVTVADINDAYKQAASDELTGILDYTEEPLVSRDLIGNPHSSIVDGLSTMVLEDGMVKVVSWYDNELAYAARCVDLAAFMSRKGL
ncbi:MAG TPA: type I glyceraldehyde-3-phosphate dehydrogenase [Bacillota bacterium]